MQKLQWVTHKMFSAPNLARECYGWRLTGKKIVFTNGCFDVLHHGHMDLLARAASFGNKLVVGINTNNSVQRLKGPARPIVSEDDRAFQIASLMWVDAVCLFDEETPEELIKMVRPDVLVKGGDYTEATIVGADFVKSIGGTVEVVPLVSGYSTTSLIERIKQSKGKGNKQLPLHKQSLR